MKTSLKNWLTERAAIIENYLNDEKTDKKVIEIVLTHLLLRLFNKQNVNFVLTCLNVESLPDFKERLAAKIGKAAADKIIKAIEKRYK